MSARPKEMSKALRAMHVAVLEALQARGCIKGYTIAGHDVIPEWNE